MSFIKHIGKHTDRKVAIVYRTVPGEEHMALVLYPETLPRIFHDSVMKVVEGDTAQTSESLADVLFRSLLPDGRQMLETLHKEGKLKKVQTAQIVITPNASSHVRLDELNKIIDGMAAGDDSAKKMADISEVVDSVEPHQNEAAIAELTDAPLMDSAVANQALDDASLGNTILQQSKQMASEAKALLAESKRLEKEAFDMNPALKPKRTVKKKAAKKAATK
jgi:hypothetical protein